MIPVERKSSIRPPPGGSGLRLISVTALSSAISGSILR
ncbi:hypothetical protein ASAP_1672 [Asaia bogorensis]|uniref:Uncharacterized protein n=1 Tax=Asaia bogorensis TaxID=91915 RepID=A0A060QKT1_9PROT|nr:hypothetical protein ASAP_1672 [Asaia bogorensis]